MCLGVQYVHAECQHKKKFVIIEGCDLAADHDCPNLVNLQLILVRAPRLCVQCFRQKEAEIDAEYETTKADLEREIARVDERVASGGSQTEEAAVSLSEYRAECEDNILQAKAARDTSIRLFRQRQGVWGDG